MIGREKFHPAAAKRQGGFTLVEVLVAVTIVALLLTTIYGVFTSVSGARQRLEGEGEGYHQARVLFDRIGREIRGAYFLTGNSATRLIGGTTSDNRPYLELTTTAGTPYGGRPGGIAVVRYELIPDPEAPAGEDTGVLMRDEYSIVDASAAEREGYRLATGLGEMTVRFFRDGRWSEQWDARSMGGVPQMVEVTLQLPVGGSLVPFRTTFEIPVI